MYLANTLAKAKEGDKTYSTWNRGDVGVVGDDRILKTSTVVRMNRGRI